MWPDSRAGFYAIAYDTSAVSGFSAGEKTIAYRGTDSLFGSDGIGGDIWNGYGVGAGSPDGDHARLAIQFYQAIAQAAGGAGAEFAPDLYVVRLPSQPIEADRSFGTRLAA